MGQKIADIGQMREKINIYSFSGDQEWTGQTDKTETLLVSVWAAIMPKPQVESTEADQTVGTDRILFQIRYREDVKNKYRLQYNGNWYEILNVSEVDHQKRRTNILAVWRDNVTT